MNYLFPMEIERIDNGYKTNTILSMFEKEVTFYKTGSGNFKLLIWEAGVGDYRLKLDNVNTPKQADIAAKEKIKELLQRSFDAVHNND